MSSNRLGGDSLISGLDHGGPAVKSKRQPAGRNWKVPALIGLIVLVGGFAIFNLFSVMQNPAAGSYYIPAVDASDPQNLVEIHEFYAPEGLTAPYRSPSTGQMAVWPAEKCFWTRDGKAKSKPTLVLLNTFLGKSGDTMCPDCGRKVWPRFPAPPDELRLQAQQEGR